MHMYIKYPILLHDLTVIQLCMRFFGKIHVTIVKIVFRANYTFVFDKIFFCVVMGIIMCSNVL